MVLNSYYPNINYELQEDETAPNHYNCPIVATYAEVIAGNMSDIFEKNKVNFYHDFYHMIMIKDLLTVFMIYYQSFQFQRGKLKSC